MEFNNSKKRKYGSENYNLKFSESHKRKICSIYENNCDLNNTSIYIKKIESTYYVNITFYNDDLYLMNQIKKYKQ